MRAITTPLWEMAEFPLIAEAMQPDASNIMLTGCVDSQKLHMIYGLGGGFTYKIIVTYSDLKAKELWEMSAAKGIFEAQYMLGFMYSNGEGVKKDYLKAKYWYRWIWVCS